MRLPAQSTYGVLAIGLALSLLLATQPEHADTPSVLPTRLEVIWSTSITVSTALRNTFGSSEGLVPDAATLAPDGRDGTGQWLPGQHARWSTSRPHVASVRRESRIPAVSRKIHLLACPNFPSFLERPVNLPFPTNNYIPPPRTYHLVRH